MTTAQIERVAKDMTDYAKEPVRVEQITSCLYVFGSELATLRIFAHYLASGSVSNPNCRVGFSKNLNKHYFSLETPGLA